MRILYSEDCEKAVNIFIHKLIDPHIKMLFNKAIDTLDCWYEIDKKSNESVMFMDNCIELIKIINMKYYDDLAEILTYILIHNDIFYYFVFHTFEIGERKSIRYVFNYLRIDIRNSTLTSKHFTNIIRATNNKCTNYFNELIFENYLDSDCVLYSQFVKDYMKNKDNINIIYTILHIGGKLNRFVIQREVLYINLEQSCKENYERIINDYYDSYKYDKFCDVYNLYRKIYI